MSAGTGGRKRPSRAAPAQPAAPIQPYVAAELSPELAATAKDLVRRLREAPRATDLRDETVALILRLTEHSLEFYFRHPVEKLEAGMLTVTSVRLGLATFSSTLSIMVRRIVGGMNEAQMRGLATIIEGMLHEWPAPAGRGES